MLLLVKVTAPLIANGQRALCDTCPIACAIRAELSEASGRDLCDWLWHRKAC